MIYLEHFLTRLWPSTNASFPEVLASYERVATALEGAFLAELHSYASGLVSDLDETLSSELRFCRGILSERLAQLVGGVA